LLPLRSFPPRDTAIDILARLYGERLSRRFGQQVIVSKRAEMSALINTHRVRYFDAGGFYGRTLWR
jgi:hypothetical protein